MADNVTYRKYGVATTIDFDLYQYALPTDLRIDAVHAAGDTKLMKDEGAEANTTNGYVDRGQGYSIALTATEMQFARGVLYVVDQGSKAWMDKVIRIETWGHASAQLQGFLNNAMFDAELDEYEALFELAVADRSGAQHSSVPTDVIAGSFWKNGIEVDPVNISGPEVALVKLADGSRITDIAGDGFTALTRVGTTFEYRYYVQGAELQVPGTAYRIEVRWTQDGALRSSKRITRRVGVPTQ